MEFVSCRGALAAVAMVTACGSAQAFTAKGNYDVTFTVTGGGSTQYCVTLASQGASGAYRDVGTATFYSGGASVASGTYVVFQRTISVAVVRPDSSEYLTAAGMFAAGQKAFYTAVIDFESNATIVGTATFTYTRNGGSCAKAAD